MEIEKKNGVGALGGRIFGRRAGSGLVGWVGRGLFGDHFLSILFLK